jgi:hypothetical protein
MLCDEQSNRRWQFEQSNRRWQFEQSNRRWQFEQSNRRWQFEHVEVTSYSVASVFAAPEACELEKEK